MTSYSQYQFYSPIHDCDCVRLSVPDSFGREFFTIIPHLNGGKEFRKLREKALDALEYAVDNGKEPGEVELEDVPHIL